MRNRCTEAFGLCRSRLTVDAKVKCSSTAQLRFPDALRDPLTPHQSFPSSALTPCSTPPSTWTSAHDHPRKHLHQHFLTSLTPHTSPFRSPIALHSYHPNPTHDSSAPWVLLLRRVGEWCGGGRRIWPRWRRLNGGVQADLRGPPPRDRGAARPRPRQGRGALMGPGVATGQGRRR